MALIPEKTRYHVVATADRESEGVQTSGDFETAVSATGYGVFNVLLLVAAIPVGWTTAFDTSTVGFMMPYAECELDLTLFRKGTLTAIPWAGMICTAFVWRFIADRVGRKYLLLFGLILDGLCNLFSSASPNYYVLLTFKFISGIIVGGPFTILMTYITEFHSQSYRTRVLMWAGLSFALGNIVVPGLARLILPLPWSFSLFNNSLIFTSWRIYLIISSLPPFLGFLAIGIFPESPKFLMSKGKSEDALKIFRRIYAMNTGKSAHTYPITVLLHETVAPSQVPSKFLPRPTKSLFSASSIFPVILVNTIYFAAMTGLNVTKAWLLQLIVFLNNFDPPEWNKTMSIPTICEKLDFEKIESFRTETAVAIANTTDTCIPMIVSPIAYTNATIIAASAVLSSFLAGFIINKFGKKSMLLVCLAVSIFCNFAMDWALSTKFFLILAAATVTLTGIATHAINAMIVEVIPNTHRASVVSLTVMTGRFGALTGNLLFSVLLSVSCNAPFYYIGALLTLGFVLTIFLSKHSENSDS